jgi:cell division control protein 6
MGTDDDSDTVHSVFQDIDEDGGGAIFAKREILQIDYVPSENRIVGRDEQIEKVAGELGPVVVGEPPNSIIIYGKTGCGKSLVAKHVSQIAAEEAENRGVRLATGYINCQQAKGNSDALSKYGREINPPESGISFPSRGISENEYFERLWTVLNRFYDAAIIVLDEVDKLKNDDLLMALSRAGEDGSVDVPIGVIAVSNKINYRDNMTERTKSSFGHNEFIFEPYDATQIKEILQNRIDAFVDGVLDDGVIPRAAALSAKEHGDARKAMRLLRYAGDQANKENADRVKESHLNDARASAEVDRLLELISGLPPHSKHVLLGLANLTKNSPEREWFRTVKIREAYVEICYQSGSDPLSAERTRQLLNELCFLEVAGSRRGSGEGKGQYSQFNLLWDPDTVLTLDQ